MMRSDSLPNYIANLPTRSVGVRAESGAAPATPAVDVASLPNGVVVGTNLVSFDPALTAQSRSGVALSLLAAQRVATNDSVLLTADQWLERHLTVLQNLSWSIESRSATEHTSDTVNVAVHEAILPVIAAALGPAAAVASVIIASLNGLKAMHDGAPWLTLFSRESRRFEVSEFHFTTVEASDSGVRLRLAAARLDASYGHTQVLFFRERNTRISFSMQSLVLTADLALLDQIAAPLRTKLGNHALAFVEALPDDLLGAIDR